MMKINTVENIVNWRLCIGCGACSYICPENRIILCDILDDGIRPAIEKGVKCQECDACVRVCPGYQVSHVFTKNDEGIKELRENWGPVLEIWEGYATDKDLRFQGSSGGVVSAVALYCLEKESMAGVVHIGPDEKKPQKNRTVWSRNRFQLLKRTGSRYSPASPCDGLEMIESSTGSSIFIGKPCDVAGLRKAQSLRPELDKKIGLAISIFCAGTPASRGTHDLLKSLNVNYEDVTSLRYRGCGWPGMFSIRIKGDNEKKELMTYMEAWGFVEKYRPYRCYLCPDGTGEFADIASGDPWYREKKEDKLGYSLILVRTEKGRKILHGAMAAGYVSLKQVHPHFLKDSQENLLQKRKAIWGRLFALKLFSLPTPEYIGFPLWKNWLTLSIKDKARSILGTLRRIIQRKYFKPISKL